MNVDLTAFVGNLTEKPAAGKLPKGTVTNLRVAKSTEWTDKVTGEAKKHTDFIDVEVFGAQGKHCLNELKKGDRVVVTGSLKYNEWSDDDGNQRSRIKVRAGVVGKSLEF